jgi:hypothetical protein
MFCKDLGLINKHNATKTRLFSTKQNQMMKLKKKKLKLMFMIKLIYINNWVEMDNNSKDTTYYKNKIIQYIMNKDQNLFLPSSTKQLKKFIILIITSFP